MRNRLANGEENMRTTGYLRLISRIVIALVVLGFHVGFADGQHSSTSSPEPVILTSELLFKSPAKPLYADEQEYS
jgi:hypothetical protein